jgi:DNA-binding IclR family transcriptional regulator
MKVISLLADNGQVSIAACRRRRAAVRTYPCWHNLAPATGNAIVRAGVWHPKDPVGISTKAVGLLIAKIKRSETTTYRNQAAQRVLTVLDAFSSKAEAVSTAELCKSLGMSNNMVHRALALLEEEGLIMRAATGQAYQLGPRVLTFASSDADQSDDINDVCRPYMETLHELTGESIFLGIMVGRNRVVIDKIEGTGRRIAHSQRGLAVPLHVSKTSRVLLAYLPNAEIEAYLRAAHPLSEYSDLFVDASHETNKDVWNDIRVIRQQGYIAWRNPQQYGGSYIAFPVLDGESRPHAVISVGAPIERLTPEQLERFLPRMVQIMASLHVRTRLLPAPPPLDVSLSAV